MFTATQKKGIVLRLLRHKTNIVSHFDSGEHQKVGAWKVEWVPSEKDNFLVLKEPVLWKTARGREVGPGCFTFTWPSKEQSSQYLPHSNVLARVTLGRQTPN